MDDTTPPHDLDAEHSVLGSILLDGKRALIQVAVKLRAEHFYRENYGQVYIAMLRLAARGEPIDNVTLASELQRAGQLDKVGGRSTLALMQSAVPTSANASYYADIVIEKAQKRALAEMGREAARRAQDPTSTAQDDIAAMQSGLFKVATSRIQHGFRPIADILNENLKQYDAMQRGEYGGVPCGFRRLDDLTGGLWAGDLVVIAGRPAMGKTSLAMNIATNCALRVPATRVGVISLEMTRAQLVERMVASEAKIDTKALHKGLLTADEEATFWRAMGPLGDAPLAIDDDPVLDEAGIMLAARQLATKHPDLGLLVLDYMQLVRGAAVHKGDKVREVGGVATALKATARELGIPVIAISQLNRGPEARPDKRPMLSDLSYSGQIEADADVVMLIYRPDYYKAGEKPGVAEVNIAKQRRGPTATVDLKFDKKFTRFEDAE